MACVPQDVPVCVPPIFRCDRLSIELMVEPTNRPLCDKLTRQDGRRRVKCDAGHKSRFTAALMLVNEWRECGSAGNGLSDGKAQGHSMADRACRRIRSLY